MGDVDAVVIGAGPNGLVAANVLADAGWKVVVLEAQPTPGGAVRSSELLGRGFVTDWCSSFYPLAVASPAFRPLALERFGLRWRRAPVTLAHPTPDGCARIEDAVEATAASVDAFAPGDGAAWMRLWETWDRVGRALVDFLLHPLPALGPALHLARDAGVHLPGFVRLSLEPMRRLARRDFTGEGGPLLLAGNMAHSDLELSSPTSAVFGWLLAGLAQQHGFPVPEGGAGELTRALVDRLAAGGSTVVCNQPVVRIDVREGRAVGVVTSDGTTVAAPRGVLADVGAPALYLDLIDRGALPASVVRRVRRFRYDPATVKVDWALDRPIPWRDDRVQPAGTVHLCDSLADLEAFGTQLAAGQVPDRPFVVMGQMTTADPTRSPAGTEVAWAYTHVPQRVSGDAGSGGITGTWDGDDAARIAERIEAEIERRAPGFSSCITARHVATPRDLEAADANLVGGAVNGGTAKLRQQLVLRPIPFSGRAFTPIRRLYLASASAHPGGGVHGACGANAARAALHDVERNR